MATATTPAGYLYCDGTTIPTSGTFQGIAASSLQDLRTLLSTTYGATGTLPNLVNRFAGYSATPGPGAGSADATLVSHNHPGSSVTGGGTHGHTYDRSDAGAGTEGGNQGVHDYNNSTPVGGNGSHSHGLSIITEGASATDANLPPYTGMRPIIKY